MHNGQIGGYDTFRRDADMMIPDALYPHRKGATDSEALFLVALSEGLDDDPQGALERAIARFEGLGRQRGLGAQVRLTCAMSDGRSLYAARYASDGQAPTLYHRWSDRLGGRAVVSEPLDLSEQDWAAVPEGSFCSFTGGDWRTHGFVPTALPLARAS